MHPTTNRFLFASMGIAALGLAAIASVQLDAAPPIAQAADVSAWVQSTPDRNLVSCPATKAAETADAPYFAFGNTLVSCLLDGPYAWNGNYWYIQRIKGAGTPPQDLIRACTAAAAHRDPASHFAGPCHTASGAGPLGCEACTLGGKPL